MPPAPDLDTALDAVVAGIGGSVRPGQHRMASAVTTAFENERHLLVQAGTGTGKSLGYLVPAVLSAHERDRPVVVATATLALQSQLITRDLPAVAGALDPLLDRPVSYALLKGRSNYACLHKLDGGYPDDLPQSALFQSAPTGDPTAQGGFERLGEQIVHLREWAAETTSGDRDDVPFPVSDRAWRQVSVSARECVGSSCPFAAECFTERSRAVAREADVIVTNHALLAIDAFDRHGIIPEYDCAVIDEGHELVDRVTSAVALTLSRGMARGAASLLRGQGRTATDLGEAADQLDEALSLLGEGRIRGALPPAVSDRMILLGASARTHLTELGESRAADPTEAAARTAMRSALTEIIEACERMTDPHEQDVLWLSRDEDGTRQMMHLAPLSVAGVLRERLLADRTIVMTSATLAIGADFTSAAGGIGLHGRDRLDEDGEPVLPGPHRDDEPEGPAWTGLDVGSPFDYARQGILYVARRLPRPGRDGTDPAVLDHVVDLVDAAGGGMLGLFSSRRGALAAAERLRASTDLDVLVQGESTLGDLVARFRDDRDSCLLGTLGLWQGVDVPGPSARLVVIDRIPFPRPDDPLSSARTEHVSRLGGNGFMSVAASHAALLMAQGAGRLIRSVTDRGMVAVLDPRLATARYGAYLTRAMPPLWRTDDAEVALAALRRLRPQD